MTELKNAMPPKLRTTLSCGGETHVCRYLPIGWDEQSASWSFDMDTFGYNIKYSTGELRFVKEDADFIRRMYDLYGISALIDIKIERRNNRWTYDVRFTGTIDLVGTYDNERDFVQVNVYEGAMKRAIEKDAKTNFEIPFEKQDSNGAWIDNDDVETIEVPEGMRLYEKIKWNFNGLRYRAATTIDPYNTYPANQIITMDVDSNSKVFSKNLIADGQNADDYSADGNITNDTPLLNRFFLKKIKSEISGLPAQNITIKFNGNIKLKFTDLSNFQMDTPVIIQLSNNRSVYNDFAQTDPNPYYNTIKTLCSFKLNDLDSNGEIELKLNDELILDFNSDKNMNNQNGDYEIAIQVWGLKFIQTAGESNYIPSSTISVSGELIAIFFGTANTGSFNFKAIKAEKLGQKLFDKIFSGVNYQIPFLQEMEAQQAMQLFVTSADAIRGILPTPVLDDAGNPTGEITQALIKTSYKELEEDLQKIYSLGLKMSDAGRWYQVVKKSDVFRRDVEVLNVSEVKEMHVKPIDQDLYKNQIQIGYEKQEYDYPLGRQESAITLEFTDDIKQTQQKLDNVTNYRGDWTGVHLLHFDYINSDKQDSKSDNDVFFILAFSKNIQNQVENIFGYDFYPLSKITSINCTVGQTVNKGDLLFTANFTDSTRNINFYVYAEHSGTITEINISVGTFVNRAIILGKINVQYKQWQAISGALELGFTVKGLEGGGYFNILLSPKHLLRNHADFFKSILDRHAKVLRYASSTDSQSALITSYNSGGDLVEKADYEIPEEIQPLFKPILFQFNCQIPQNLPEILGESPAGYLTFKYNGLTIKGFPIDIQGNINKSEQQVTCVAHPDTPDDIQEILFKKLPSKIYP
jgi:hypothetical protein